MSKANKPKEEPTLSVVEGLEAQVVQGQEVEAQNAYYRAVHGGPMIDPDSLVTYTSEAVEGPMTGWLEAQIEANKIVVA